MNPITSSESYGMSETTATTDFATRVESPKSPSITFQNFSAFQNVSTTDPPEIVLADAMTRRSTTMESFLKRPRSLSHHLSSKIIPTRRMLKVKARWWRALMTLGMRFHDWAPPYPPKPAFKRTIPTDTIPIELYFYLPPSFYRTLHADPQYRFPAVINFHGGGFVLGDARDDRYWAKMVTEQTQSVFVSVNYRRAPEHPFPIPVDDCVESILYVAENASELHIDGSNLALSGFSAGANLAFTAPFRLAYHRNRPAFAKPEEHPPEDRPSEPHHAPQRDSLFPRDDSPIDGDDEEEEAHSHETTSFVTPVHSTSNLLQTRTNSPLRIRTIIAWYPLLDWTISRSRKIRESRNPQKCLPKTFTDLFDFSYLPAPDVRGRHCSPYASPALARDGMIKHGLPENIQMWLCEWDMLLAEGQAFSDRLQRLGKNVSTRVIPRVPHAWDKSPNPFRDQPAINALYSKACQKLNVVFADVDSRRVHIGSSSSSLQVTESLIDRQPRRSMVPM